MRWKSIVKIQQSMFVVSHAQSISDSFILWLFNYWIANFAKTTESFVNLIWNYLKKEKTSNNNKTLRVSWTIPWKKSISLSLQFTVLIAFRFLRHTTNLQPLFLVLILRACHWYFLFHFSSSWAHLCIVLMITNVYHSLISGIRSKEI